jgi:hypothetical protein
MASAVMAMDELNITSAYMHMLILKARRDGERRNRHAGDWQQPLR